MSDILVHAGNLKTGSSAIQAVLVAMRPALAASGVVMPALKPKERGHFRFGREVRQRPIQTGAPAAAELLAALRQVGAAETPLLTAEPIMAADPWSLHDFLGQIPKRTPRFLFYMRPHASLLASHYLELVKTGKYSASVSDLLTQLMRLPVMRFIEVVSNFADEFGDDALTVREFSRERLVSGSIIADFWDAFALPPALLAEALAHETIRNPTPTMEASVLLRAWQGELVRRFGRDDHLGLLRGPVTTLFDTLTGADLPGQKFHLPVALQQQLAEDWEAPRKAFAQRWFQLPPTDTWLSEPIVAPSAPQPLPYDAVAAAATDAIKRMRRQDMALQADQMPGFLASLPVETEGGERMIDIAALEVRIDPKAAAIRPARVRPAPTPAKPSPQSSSPERSIQET